MSEGAHRSMDIEDLVLRHERLRARAERVAVTDGAAVIDLGSAVLLHRAVQVARSAELLTWLDPAVIARIEEEQDLLADDLELLRELVESAPASEDACALGEALVRRLQDCLHHDERVLLRPLLRLAGAWGASHALATELPRSAKRGEA